MPSSHCSDICDVKMKSVGSISVEISKLWMNMSMMFYLSLSIEIEIIIFIYMALLCKM